ncbi:MAG: hypothetical protein OEW48_20145, partial [Phycisphaerae bacterium]|nr:hypothetical protein [Phycisphaerae bacterium]
TELKKRLPKKNANVKTKYGEGKVTGTQILTQLVMLELGDGQRIAVPLDEIEVISSPAAAKNNKGTAPEGNQQDNDESTNDSEIQDSAGPPEQ